MRRKTSANPRGTAQFGPCVHNIVWYQHDFSLPVAADPQYVATMHPLQTASGITCHNPCPTANVTKIVIKTNRTVVVLEPRLTQQSIELTITTTTTIVTLTLQDGNGMHFILTDKCMYVKTKESLKCCKMS